MSVHNNLTLSPRTYTSPKPNACYGAVLSGSCEARAKSVDCGERIRYQRGET